jgi:hypothetical protein
MPLRLMLLMALLGGCSATSGAKAATCEALGKAAGGVADASAALAACLREVAAGGRIELKPGVYRLQRPIRIDKPVTIVTAGLGNNSPGCGSSSSRCATLRIDIEAEGAAKRTMPVEIIADGVTLSHLVIDGSGMSPARRRFCGQPELRPLGGGLRVSGSNFALRNSWLRNVACYTALEIVTGSKNPVIAGNVIGPNGDHRPGQNWSDGVTVHDSAGALVTANLFIDNTDVQLIFGGCRSCRIVANRFRHSGSFQGGSFADLMIHAWPSSSGDYEGSVFERNDVDCGPLRRCGYGIMIGSSPWYDQPVKGAKVTGNRIANAMIGLNVDALDGPTEISGNRVVDSGGRFWSDCGTHSWPAANVAPGSGRFVIGDPTNVEEGSVATAHCLLNRDNQ